jgi:hypothetical protein
MYKFQDYYGEDATCDPYYEDCTAPEEETMEHDMMLEEESACVPPSVTLWGLVPAFDLAAGYLTWTDFKNDADVDTYYDLTGISLNEDMQL